MSVVEQDMTLNGFVVLQLYVMKFYYVLMKSYLIKNHLFEDRVILVLI